MKYMIISNLVIWIGMGIYLLFLNKKQKEIEDKVLEIKVIKEEE